MERKSKILRLDQVTSAEGRVLTVLGKTGGKQYPLFACFIVDCSCIQTAHLGIYIRKFESLLYNSHFHSIIEGLGSRALARSTSTQSCTLKF